MSSDAHNLVNDIIKSKETPYGATEKKSNLEHAPPLIDL